MMFFERAVVLAKKAYCDDVAPLAEGDYGGHL